jgi:hypothetical protein
LWGRHKDHTSTDIATIWQQHGTVSLLRLVIQPSWLTVRLGLVDRISTKLQGLRQRQSTLLTKMHSVEEKVDRVQEDQREALEHVSNMFWLFYK